MTKTVLVLGAGASAPYGFPSGEGLKDGIARLLLGQHPARGPLRGLDLTERLLAAGFSSEGLSRFGNTLASSQRFSIDAFLENRREFWDVGKAAIVASIARFEEASSIARGVTVGGDWIRYLYDKLGDTIQEQVSRPLSVVTFNYDRSFETWICQAWAADHGTSIDEGREFLGRLAVLHVHGDIGEQDYGTAPGALNLRESASRVRLVSEDAADDERFKQARALILDAQRVCFLGFGYHPMNVRRLEIYNEWPKGSPAAILGHPPPPRKRVLGAAFDITPTEQQQIARLFSVPCDFPDRGHELDALAFLRNSTFLRDLLK